MAREQKFSASQREAAQHIPDDVVANAPAVVAARRALANAESGYAATMQPRLAAKRRLEELQTELAAAQKQLGESDARRAEVALGVTDGALSGGAYHALRQMLDEVRGEIERIELSIPALAARYEATATPTERAANELADAQSALAAAIKAAKLKLAVARDA